MICLPSPVIEDKLLLNNFAENLELLTANGDLNFTIVHDYKGLLTKYLELFSIRKELYDLQFGSDNAADLLEMIISGYLNKRIVSRLCSFGLHAIGFSGKDGNLVVARKSKESGNDISQFYIGEPLEINPEILFEMEETKLIPVIAPVASNDKGRTMILAAEITAAMIAVATNVNKFIMFCEDDFLTKQVGTLASVAEFDKLLHQNIQVNPKSPLIKAARHVLLNSEASVYFASIHHPDALLMSIFDQLE